MAQYGRRGTTNSGLAGRDANRFQHAISLHDDDRHSHAIELSVETQQKRKTRHKMMEEKAHETTSKHLQGRSARRDSAEDFSRLNALLFTAMAWIFIPAYCFAVP